MNLFEIVKTSVCVPEAARAYGLDVTRHNMTRCPFHDDRHPSLKLNPDFYYCFGCGARGDVIDLVAGLFDLSPYEAARKIAADFGIDTDKPPEAEPDDRFVEACQMLDHIEYLADVLTVGDLDQREAVVAEMMKEGKIIGLEDRLLMVDDDMDMSALTKTNYIKSIVTSECQMDVERKGIQSYQSLLYVRFLCFGNGALTALHDRSDGFFRRQIVITTKDKPEGRVESCMRRQHVRQ